MNTFSLERLSGGFEHAFEELYLLVEEGNTVEVYCNNIAEKNRLNELLWKKAEGWQIK